MSEWTPVNGGLNRIRKRESQFKLPSMASPTPEELSTPIDNDLEKGGVWNNTDKVSLLPVLYDPQPNPYLTNFQYMVLLAALNQAGVTRVDFNKVNIRGRTPKAISHMWAKMKADLVAFGKGEEVSELFSEVPKKSRTRKSDGMSSLSLTSL
jgi:hypothetical protein